MGTKDYTEQDFDLADLTDEERAALEEADEELDELDEDETEDDGGEESESDDAADENEDTAADSGDEDKESKGDEPDENKEEQADSADDGTEDKDEDASSDETAQKSPVAKPTFTPPDGLETKLKEIDTKLDDIAEKFDDGELTAAEFRREQRTLTDERDDVRSQQIRAQVSTDIQSANWLDTCTEFWTEHEQYAPGSPLHAALDLEVRRLQTEAGYDYDPAFLETAHENIMQSFPGAKPVKGETNEEETNEDADKGKVEGKGKGKSKNKSSGLGDIPPNLADVPASDIDDANDGGQFAHLDRLQQSNLERYEAAVEKLSDADREAYLLSR